MPSIPSQGSSFRLGALELGLEGLSTDPSAGVDFRLDARVEEKGQVNASGKAEPWNRKVEGRVEIANFPLVSLQPYLDPRMRLDLESGGVDGQGEFRYGESENGIFTYHGKGNIHTFRARVGASQPFWEWDSLACDEINLSVSPSVLELGHVRAIKPSGRLLIQEDGTVNLSRIMTVREREQGNTEAPGQPFRFVAERLQVEQGSLDFADLSLTPQFGALIHDLRGTITGISSVSGTLAKVELDGQALKSLLIRNRVEAKEDRALKPGEEPGPIIFHRPETQEALEELFLEYSSPDVLEKLRAEYRNELPAEQRGLDSEQRAAAWADFYRDLYRGIEERIEISGDRIRALAEARALAIKQFLVEERRIDPSRLDVIEPLRTGGSDGKEVKSRLSLDVRRQG